MLSVSVYVLGDKGRTVATVNHAAEKASNVKVKFVSSVAEIEQLLKDDESDLVHFVPSGAVILPSFYDAMLSHLEHSHRDFVFCPCIKIDGNAKTLKELRPGDSDFSHGQMIIRRWVVKELNADVGNLSRLAVRIINEYRGIEIPHNLYMEI